MNKYKVISSLVSTGTYEEFIKKILELVKEGKSSYICVSNVHMLIEAYRNNLFSNVVNNSELTTPDGMPLAKGIKLLYGISQDRVAGMDLVPDLMQASESQNYSIFIYGATPIVLEKVIKKAKKEFPRLKIEVESPPFRKLTDKENLETIKNINNINPDFVFVALGCPKQEKWMAEHKGKINSCMIGLGGAIEVYAEVKNRAPKWMQDNSLEWLHRLIQDPRRLWKRYLVTNSLFIGLFLVQYIKIKVFKRFD